MSDEDWVVVVQVFEAARSAAARSMSAAANARITTPLCDGGGRSGRLVADAGLVSFGGGAESGWPPTARRPSSFLVTPLLVTPGLDPGAQAASVAVGRTSPFMDARVNPRIKSGDAHDADGGGG